MRKKSEEKGPFLGLGLGLELGLRTGFLASGELIPPDTGLLEPKDSPLQADVKHKRRDSLDLRGGKAGGFGGSRRGKR